MVFRQSTRFDSPPFLPPPEKEKQVKQHQPQHASKNYRADLPSVQAGHGVQGQKETVFRQLDLKPVSIDLPDSIGKRLALEGQQLSKKMIDLFPFVGDRFMGSHHDLHAVGVYGEVGVGEAVSFVYEGVLEVRLAFDRNEGGHGKAFPCEFLGSGYCDGSFGTEAIANVGDLDQNHAGDKGEGQHLEGIQRDFFEQRKHGSSRRRCPGRAGSR